LGSTETLGIILGFMLLKAKYKISQNISHELSSSM